MRRGKKKRDCSLSSSSAKSFCSTQGIDADYNLRKTNKGIIRKKMKFFVNLKISSMKCNLSELQEETRTSFNKFKC